MKDHAKALWGHLPPAVQHIARSAFAGAGIGMLTALFAETMKQVGVQPSTGPSPQRQADNRQNWTGNEHHRRHHTHHHWKGRS